MPKIRGIQITNFRSIVSLDVDARDLTVIVGDNDSGKSNILRALNLFFNGETNPGTPFNFSNDYNRFVEPRAKKAPEIEVQLYLELPESYRENNGDLILWRKRWRENGLQQSDEYWGVRQEKHKRGLGFREELFELSGRSRVPQLLSRVQFEYVPAVRSAEFFRTLRGRIFQVIAKISEQSVRRSSGQFETVITEAVGGLLDNITEELQDHSTLRLPNDLTPIFENLDFLNGEKSISLDNRGDGIKARYIPLILKFIAEKSREVGGLAPTFIWAYEEPENNLEFRRAQALADAFKKLAEDEFSQVFLTTHSPIFYNMYQAEAETDLCAAYHLTHEGTTDGTKARSALEATISLDESMGAMAIIAPHIMAAQNALADATAQAADLKAKLDQGNQENRPAIFVEGYSDFIIYKALLNRFRPDYLDRIFLAEPPQQAGANYVTNMLRSWEYRTKHLPKEERTKAVGILDADNEGMQVAKRFKAEQHNWKFVFLSTPLVPDHLLPMLELGIELEISSEELWPKDVWLKAEQKGWLVARPKKGLIGEKLTLRLADEDAKLSNLIHDDWRIYFESCVSSVTEDRSKVLWAEYMVRPTNNRLEQQAVEFLKTLDAAIAQILVTPS